MILADKENDTQLMMLVPSIKHYMNEWQIVNINVLKESQLTRKRIMERVLQIYEKYDGLIYPVSPKKIIMLIRLGLLHNYMYMKKDLEKKMPDHCCCITMRKMNAIVGLKQVQIDLLECDEGVVLEESMYDQRQKRSGNVILIADDDKFIRTSMAKLLAIAGMLVEAQDSSKVISQYLEHNPDIVFLDIHMLGKNGLDLIRDIIGIDPDAYIIVLSADSSAGNVMKALEEGASGFLSKPPAKVKVREYLSQCITVK